MNDNNIIIRTVTRFLLPFIQIFALYVIAHGELGPGGGFQGGVIFGAGIVLVALAYGKEKARSIVSTTWSDALNSAGVLVYAGIGVICMLLGGMFLEYGVLPFGNAEKGNHMGMIGIEIGVGITVAAVIMTIFFEAAEKNDD
ncbi:Na(+)/H(+) antiporter subunit B [Limisalsivibrio acetivorans]|uniref:Na(+)/H(+) antiporter subunit B n=1 Tax=Limisalsivibrio acetivorans TaxID=1304888 RepID=UPI00040F7B7D|nr:Na(+)/H(+) antiporter subunit B [Limisalsivibrio acetivorans]